MGPWGLFFWTALLPQASVWIYLTIVGGILFGAAAVAIRRKRGAGRPRRRVTRPDRGFALVGVQRPQLVVPARLGGGASRPLGALQPGREHVHGGIDLASRGASTTMATCR
jgi:hypothetical protein